MRRGINYHWGGAGGGSGYGQYRQILNRIRDKYSKVPLTGKSNVHMVGLLFVRPTSALARTDINPNIPYWHHRSGEHIDFFCAGFPTLWDPTKGPDEQLMAAFSAPDFNELRKEIEQRSKWRYSGGMDLILVNAYCTDVSAELDFSCAIACDLVRMKEDGAIVNVEAFFEQIFQYVEHRASENPVWEFSDAAGLRVTRSAIWNLVISLFPKALQKGAKQARYYAVTNIAK